MRMEWQPEQIQRTDPTATHNLHNPKVRAVSDLDLEIQHYQAQDRAERRRHATPHTHRPSYSVSRVLHHQ